MTVSKQDNERLTALWSQGKTIKSVANLMNLSQGAVQGRIRKLGLQRKSPERVSYCFYLRMNKKLFDKVQKAAFDAGMQVSPFIRSILERELGDGTK